jgi:phosphatidylinositol kinase/protein kinase (PI-3  family)
MLVKAMEISGIEGSFRSTSEKVCEVVKYFIVFVVDNVIDVIIPSNY